MNFNGKYHIPWNTNFKFLAATSSIILFYNHIYRPAGDYTFADYANDGLVDLPSALFPKGEPYMFYDPDDIRPGVWNVMRTRHGDHGTPIGLFTPVEETWELYDGMFEMLRDVESRIDSAKVEIPAPVAAKSASAPRKRKKKATAEKADKGEKTDKGDKQE